MTTEFEITLQQIQRKGGPLAAVTAAIIDIDTDNNNPAKVYAHVIATLERNVLEHHDATQTVLLELLQVTLPHVNAAVLQATLPVSSRVLRAIIVAAGNDDEDANESHKLMKLVTQTATVLLKNTPTTADEKTVQTLLQGVHVALLKHPRHTLQTFARDCILELFNEPKCHVAIIKTISSMVYSQVKQFTKQDMVEHYQHATQFLLQTLPMLPFLDYMKIGECIMQVISIQCSATTANSDDFVNIGSNNKKMRENKPKFALIRTLLSGVALLLNRDESSWQKISASDFSARVLATLLQINTALLFQAGSLPNEDLEASKLMYGQTIILSLSSVTLTQPNVAVKLLPLAVQKIVQLSKPEDDADEMDTTEASFADTLLIELGQYFRENANSFSGIASDQVVKTYQDCWQAFQPALSLQYSSIWSSLLKTAVVVLLKILHTDDMSDATESIITLHSEVPPGSAAQLAVRDAFSALVQGAGIDLVWYWIRWDTRDAEMSDSITGISTDRVWLLSTLKSAATAVQPSRPSLSFFQNEVLKLARSCDKMTAQDPKNKIVHQNTVIELWSLLPCFCLNPVDIGTALESLTAIIVRAVDDKRYPQLMSVVCQSLIVLCDSQKNEIDGELNKTQATTTMSETMLPVLFRIATDTQPTTPDGKIDPAEVADKNQQLQCITECISSIAQFAEVRFVKGLFKKVMRLLLDEVQKDGTDESRVCALLSLTQAIVQSKTIEESDVSFSYRALKPILTKKGTDYKVQKRAYKLLLAMCTCYHEFFTAPDQFNELLSLLTNTISSSQVAARSMRLKCISIVIENIDKENTAQMNLLKSILPEVLLCLKDTNGKTRECAFQAILSFTKKLGIHESLTVIAAALAAETPHMRSAGVTALSRIVYEYAQNDEELKLALPSMLQTVLVLMKEDKREVVKSVIGFVRVCVALLPHDILQTLLPDIVRSLLQYQHAKQRFRTKIKIILKRLVKKFGYDALMPYVPESETRILTHMRKLDERQARKKSSSSKQESNNNFDEMLDSDEEDSDDGMTLMSGLTGFTKMTGKNTGLKSAKSASKSVATGKTSKSRKSTTANRIQLPNDHDGDVLDMLDSSFKKRVTFAKINDGDDDSDESDFEMDNDGRLIIPADDDNDIGTRTSTTINEPLYKKRRFDGSANKSVMSKQSSKGQKKGKGRDLGAAYKSKRAGGDVKKSGQKYEPYAYVPLDGKAYTKKNRRSAVESMSTVVRGKGKRKRN